jgi:dienelactone hydrolase
MRVLAMLLLTVSPALAAVKTRTIEYDVAGTKCKGLLAWDDAKTGKQPGVVVFHEWWGLNDYAKKRAEMLAKEGYVAFCADMFGNGKIADHPDDAKKFAGEVRASAATWLARAEAAHKTLVAQPEVDAAKVGAIGYCFGGTTALTLALSGADVKATAVFHAGLPVITPEQAKKVKGKLLICHGAADEFIPMDACTKFLKAFDDANNKCYEFIAYPGATHSFTVEGVEKKMKDLKYDAEADRKSWTSMLKLFKENLK